MKKETIHTILLLAALLLILIFGDADPDIRQHPKPEAPAHTCTDQTHKNCDGKCECDGLECGNTLTTH